KSSSERDRNRGRRTYRRYKRTRGRDATPPIDGHTPFSIRILKVQPPKHFIKPTDIKYDGSTDPHIRLNDFEHRMICDDAVDEVKCRAFHTTITGLASQWFTSLPTGSVSSYSEIRELFLNELTTSIDNTKVASLCLTNGLPNDEFRKQLMTKPVWTRKDMQVIAKEFIHREEANRVVTATKNPQAHTVPRGQGQTHHPRDNHQETGSRGKPKPPKQKFDHYIPLVASITEIYHRGYGHKTQYCYDLKDAIEQAIRDDKLNEFIQIIWEPRTSDR
ncbi:hypothetical protein PIB30_106625, partial [Stylosanthes scabra]|nr:hypothetical protein [Stylosanthes scabra]